MSIHTKKIAQSNPAMPACIKTLHGFDWAISTSMVSLIISPGIAQLRQIFIPTPFWRCPIHLFAQISDTLNSLTFRSPGPVDANCHTLFSFCLWSNACKSASCSMTDDLIIPARREGPRRCSTYESQNCDEAYAD